MKILRPLRHRSPVATSIWLILGLVIAGGCEQDAGTSAERSAETTAEATATAGADPTTDTGPLQAVVTTPGGSFTIQFRPDVAPIACASFVNLVQRGFFDGLLFYRHSTVIRQAGNPHNDADRRWNCGYTIAPEFSPDLRFDRGGLVALVKLTDDDASPVRPNEFFVTVKPQSERFTFKFPAFAEVVDGMDVVLGIAENDRIDTIRLVGDPRSILEPHADLVASWNAALDAMPDPRDAG